jgi:hypothetical protein
MKRGDRDAEIRQKPVCAYVGRKAMMADRSLFTESFTSLSGRSVLEKRRFEARHVHGLMSEGRQGKLHHRTSPHRVKDSKERANEGAQFIISRLQQVKGHKCCQIGLKGWVVEEGGGSWGRWKGGGIDGIKARDS